MSIAKKVNYEELTRQQKFSVFLVMLGPEAASALIENFEDEEVETICRDIAKFQLVDIETQKKVIEELKDVLQFSQSSVIGGQSFAQKVLERTQGDNKAEDWLNRIAPSDGVANILREMGEMEPEQLYNLIADEQPQTIAFLFSNLNPEKAAAALSLLPDRMRDQVLTRLGGMAPTSVENMNKVLRSLESRLGKGEKPELRTSGGVDCLAQLLNFMDKGLRREILSSIEDEDEALGAAVKKKMFSFEDITTLQVSDLQRISREVEMNDLVLALKNASDGLKDAIFGSVSKRAAETIKDEMEMLGSVRLKEVESAQDRIIQALRLLEEQGEITLDQGDDELVG